MNDGADNTHGQVTTDLPLQTQLMGSLALVFILSGIAGVLGYATFDATSLENSARAKSTMYSSNLSSELYAQSPLATGGTPKKSSCRWSAIATYTALPCMRRAAVDSRDTASSPKRWPAASRSGSPTIGCC